MLGNTSFMQSVLKNDLEYIKSILEKLSVEDLRNILNMTNDYGENVLIMAISQKKDKLSKYFLNNFGSLINLDQSNIDGETALSIAIKNNNKEIVKELIYLGANLEIVDMHGNTPLLSAIYFSNVDLEIVKLLIINGANTKAKNESADMTAAEMFNGEYPDLNFNNFVKQIYIERNMAINRLISEKGPEKIIKKFLDSGKKKKKRKSRK